MMGLEGRSGGETFHRAWKATRGLEGLTLDGTVTPLATVLMSREGKTVSKVTLAQSKLIVRNLNLDCDSREL